MTNNNIHSPLVQLIAALLRRLVIAGLAVGMAAILAAPAAHAQPSDLASVSPARSAKVSREYLIKAALLFNFAKFAEWPATAFANDTAPLRICVLGEDPFGVALQSLQGKTVRDRALTTTLITRMEDAPACHILFVSGSERGQLEGILDAVGSLPVLTVADMGQFTGSGGIVALKKAKDRSRLEINVGAATKAGLKLSSKLLRVADTVSTQTARLPGASK